MGEWVHSFVYVTTFSTLDVNTSYWKTGIAEKDRGKTGFTSKHSLCWILSIASWAMRLSLDVFTQPEHHTVTCKAAICTCLLRRHPHFHVEPETAHFIDRIVLKILKQERVTLNFKSAWFHRQYWLYQTQRLPDRLQICLPMTEEINGRSDERKRFEIILRPVQC